MSSRRVIVVGGGAAGFFAAIACAEASPGTEVVVLERGARFLDKVRISGGGRCNVTHACFDAREFVTRYPRGAKAPLARSDSDLRRGGPRLHRRGRFALRPNRSRQGDGRSCCGAADRFPGAADGVRLRAEEAEDQRNEGHGGRQR